MSFITKTQYNDILNTFTILDEQYWSFFKVYDRATRDKETTVKYLDYSGDPYVNPLISAEYLFKDESTSTIDIGLVGMYLTKQKIGDWTLANLMAFSNACCVDIENIRILLDVIEEFGTNISNMENTTVTLNFIRTTKCTEVCKDRITQYGFYDQVLDMMGYLDNNTLESVINTKELRKDIESLVKDLQNLKDSVISLTVEE